VEEPLTAAQPLCAAAILQRAMSQHQFSPDTSTGAAKICPSAMREIEFVVPRNADLTQSVKLIENICAQHELILSMKGSLAAYPGCIHWHYKRKNQKGTLELTLFAREQRLWAKVQDGRKAPWIDEELPALQLDIQRALRADAS
jgi:hypothetical protein